MNSSTPAMVATTAMGWILGRDRGAGALGSCMNGCECTAGWLVVGGLWLVGRERRAGSWRSWGVGVRRVREVRRVRGFNRSDLS